MGPLRFQSLIAKFGSATLALEAGVENWREVPSFDPDLVSRLKEQMNGAQREAEEDWESLASGKVSVKIWQSDDYPRLLRHISSAPPVLYFKGEDISVDRPAVAIVGSRQCTYYGQTMAKILSRDLAEAGVTTVSGLARGIDSCVHNASLESSGRTWAVIGSGLNCLYPPENKRLAEMIEKKGGAVISEFPLRTKPLPPHFPRRNRIIAGLSLGTVVIEGSAKSGSLITARLAAEEGRDVFAVPGPVTSPLSAAPHRLIRMGAKMVERAEDIFEEFPEEIQRQLIGKSKLAQQIQSHFPQAHLEVLALLGGSPVPREILNAQIKMASGDLSALLLTMELQGLIATLPGGLLVKK